MDVTNTLQTPTAIPTNENDIVQNPDGILGKDDFLKLLLVELQYQDPTDPMDSDKILTQTSELATLEATDNTNKALEELSATLNNSTQFSSVSAIGKMGSLGTNGIVLPEDGDANFELYFPEAISSGNVTITDVNGNTVRNFDLSALPAGVNAFSWDGNDDAGNRLPEGTYYIEASYVTESGTSGATAYGVYPIESVRFDQGQTYLKMGSQYFPLEDVVEIYEG